MTDELNLPHGNSMNGTNDSGYQVQARYMGPDGAKKVGDMMLCATWKTINFKKSHGGVPGGKAFEFWLPATDCMNFSAAQALRWWFIAEAEAELFGSLCLETRIVRFKIDYSVKAEAVSVLEEPADAWRERI